MNQARVRAFFGMAVLYFVALYAYMPSLSAYTKQFTSVNAAIGAVAAMYGLCMAVLRMPLGVLTDATGRSKPYLVGGVILAGVGALVMAYGGSLGMLAFGRALTGAAAAAWVPMMVVFAGFFPPERTIFATSILALASSVGQMIGTGLTGFLESLGGYTLAFQAAAGFSVAAVAILAFVRIPRTSADHRGHVTARSIMSIFRRPDVLVPSFTNALCQFGVWALTFTFMPLLARDAGAGAVATGLIMTLNIAANMAGNLFATLAANRGGRRRALFIIYGSLALFSAGAAAACFGPSVPLLFVSTLAMGLANGIFFPILLGLSIQHVDAGHRSTAMGIHQSVYAIGMFTGPWIGGIISDALGIPAMFAIVAAFCLVAPGVLIAFNRAPSSSSGPASASA